MPDRFLRGGLFAFAVFTAVSFLIYAANGKGITSLMRGLASASAKITSGGAGGFEAADDGGKEQDFALNDSSVQFSMLTDKLIKLSGDFGWGIEEAPEETEEPEDIAEKPSGELMYPEALNDDGGKIIRKTYTYNPTTSCAELPDGGMIRNSTDVEMTYLLEQAKKEPDLSISLDGSPQVLIMHTHTTECYEPSEREYFDSEFSSRTTELDKSVAAVGGEIAAALEAAGIGVIHDKTVHDYPKYTGAYDRSSKTAERLLKENPSIKIVIDVHRDAIESEGVRYAPVCEVDGKKAAQVMIICGNMNVPKFRYNLRFASKLQSKLEGDYPGLTRPILFAERNYNQELTEASILIEMGSDSNSFDEAMYSGRLLGMSLAELLTSLAE